MGSSCSVCRHCIHSQLFCVDSAQYKRAAVFSCRTDHPSLALEWPRSLVQRLAQVYSREFIPGSCLQDVPVYYVVRCPDEGRTLSCCSNSQSVLSAGYEKPCHSSEDEWEYKSPGYVSWWQFSLLEPRVGLVLALVLTRHAGAQHQELSGQRKTGRMPSCSSPI